jgi:hypothetical protein
MYFDGLWSSLYFEEKVLVMRTATKKALFVIQNLKQTQAYIPYTQ